MDREKTRPPPSSQATGAAIAIAGEIAKVAFRSPCTVETRPQRSNQISKLRSLLHMQRLLEKGPPIRRLLDNLGGRFSRSVPGLGLDADQYGRRPLLRVLQRGGVLEAVTGNHAVVVVGGSYHRRRILRPHFDIV